MKIPLIGLFLLMNVLVSAAYAAAPDFYAGFKDLPPSVNLYHYKVPDKVLRAQVEAAKKQAMQKVRQGQAQTTINFLVLPQLYVFNGAGQEIMARTAESADLDKLLDQAFAKAAPIKNGRSLTSVLSGLVPDGKTSSVPPSATSRFTMLEYWAPWCVYCFEERDQLAAYFRKHRDLPVNWITVNADITKVITVKNVHE